MRKHSVLSHSIALAVTLFLLSGMGQAQAAQVVTDNIRQWAHQALSDEAALDFKPAANTVAVLYFKNQTKRSELDFLQKGMSVMLITDLAKLKDVQVVERTHLQALVQEMQMGSSGIVAADTAPRVGRLLGARYLVGGDLNTVQTDAIRIDSSLLNVPQNGILGNPTSSGGMEALLSMEKEILFELVRLLRIDLTEAQKAELRKPITTNIKALMFLVQGIQSSDQGDYAQAAEFYERALKLDPGLEQAESALTELRDLKLISPDPGTEALLRDLRNRVSVNRGPIPDQITKRRNSEPASVPGPGGTGTQPANVRVGW
jgi:TolB-like protein